MPGVSEEVNQPEDRGSGKAGQLTFLFARVYVYHVIPRSQAGYESDARWKCLDERAVETIEAVPMS